MSTANEPIGSGTWVVLPTYNEADNLRPIAEAILAALPGGVLLVVDDSSPDGTGDLADGLAAADPRIRVRHRAAKQGLGPAYLDGFRVALDGGAATVVQMDADWSHDPASLPALVAPIADGSADLVIGSRYTRGGKVVDWGIGRRIVSRGGSTYARVILGLPVNDLTGGFKAWRARTLASIPFDGIHSGGYVFQIEMTYRARRLGARLREVPITFRDRRVGQSKMSRRIIGEALVVVLQLRWEQFRVGARSVADEVEVGAPGDPDGRPRGTRVVLDLRGLADPERAPTTAAYLDQLLRAFAAEPVPGESFAIIVNAGQADPTAHLPDLPVVARRRMPPTRVLRSGALTVDPFLLRAAAVGTAWRSSESGAGGAVYHAIGGPLPLASGLPVVVSLLDLAPFELPGAYQRSAAARFGQRLRARLLHDAARVIVASEATARTAIRLVHLHRERMAVIPLAAEAVFRPLVDVPGGRQALADERTRLGLLDRYIVFFGRYDARRDLGTLLEALGRLRAADRPRDLEAGAEWPPRVLLVGANPDDRAALARAAERWGVGDLVAYAPSVDEARLGLLVAGARLALVPALSEATGLAALEALAAGTPVVASAVGALPEVVGAAGILVEPRDPDRLAAALEALWVDGRVHDRIVDAVTRRLREPRRTWADVARETREVYVLAAAGLRPAE